MQSWRFRSRVCLCNSENAQRNLEIVQIPGLRGTHSQWRSQDIADARAQHGLRLYEILRKVQKHLGGLGHALSAYAVSL